LTSIKHHSLKSLLPDSNTKHIFCFHGSCKIKIC